MKRSVFMELRDEYMWIIKLFMQTLLVITYVVLTKILPVAKKIFVWVNSFKDCNPATFEQFTLNAQTFYQKEWTSKLSNTVFLIEIFRQVIIT